MCYVLTAPPHASSCMCHQSHALDRMWVALKASNSRRTPPSNAEVNSGRIKVSLTCSTYMIDDTPSTELQAKFLHLFPPSQTTSVVIGILSRDIDRYAFVIHVGETSESRVSVPRSPTTTDGYWISLPFPGTATRRRRTHNECVAHARPTDSGANLQHAPPYKPEYPSTPSPPTARARKATEGPHDVRRTGRLSLYHDTRSPIQLGLQALRGRPPSGYSQTNLRHA